MVANISRDNPDNFEETYVEQLGNPCIKSKYIKIVKHKKITLKTCKIQEINANLCESYDLPLLSRRIYIALLFDEYTYKSRIFLL